MLGFLTPLRLHLRAGLIVSGGVFLCVSAAGELYPARYLAKARVWAPGLPATAGPTAGESATHRARRDPRPPPGHWDVESTASSPQLAEAQLREALQELEAASVPAVAEPAPSPPARVERLLVNPLSEEAHRRVAALDAGLLALDARVRAVQGQVGTAARGVSRQKADPRISGADAEGPKQAAKRLVLFRARLQELLSRYAPSHPDVQRKIAEVAALERRLADLREKEHHVEPRERELESELAELLNGYWGAERQALEAEKARWQAVLDEFDATRDNPVAPRPPEPSPAKREAGELRVVWGPQVRHHSGVPKGFLFWGLAASLVAGGVTIRVRHGRGKKIWSPGDLPGGPWGDVVFSASRFATPGQEVRGALGLVASLCPWAAALSFLS